MKQIITIQVGQSGNQIGNAIWNQMMDDCGEKLDDKFFRKGIPRTILVDNEENTLDKIRGNKNLSYYDPNNFVCGKSAKCLTFASGYYGQNDLFDEIVEKVRKEQEQCDGIQADLELELNQYIIQVIIFVIVQKSTFLFIHQNMKIVLFIHIIVYLVQCISIIIIIWDSILIMIHYNK
ncbi:unnamed protein product [Paramecium primaurelia]|uniref:Tubulin/FtsZ GTPase domain-containing protein n=1 Tax=Paramecium primaurelia TaxID=5886 RepID=A0A8S1Q880_PARPR|nr:unnamed protein product [Paramecium primaurelia]